MLLLAIIPPAACSVNVPFDDGPVPMIMLVVPPLLLLLPMLMVWVPELKDELPIWIVVALAALNLGAANATTIQIGSSSLSSGTQTINIGNSNNSGGTTNIIIGTGPSSNGTLTLQAAGGIIANSSITQAVSTGSSSGTISLLGQNATNSNTTSFSTTIN